MINGIVWREPPQLAEQLVARDVVSPGICHGLLERHDVLVVVALCGDSFDSAELRERVDLVGF